MLRIAAETPRSQACHQHPQPPQSVRLDAVANSWALDGPANQARFVEDFQMLRYRGLRERQLLDDLPANATLAPRQQPQDLHTDRVSHCLRKKRKLLIGLIPLYGPEIWSRIGGAAVLRCLGHEFILSHTADF